MTTLPSHAERQAPALRLLTPGTLVGHANPDLRSWAGCVTANGAGAWSRAETGDIWVIWYAGDVPPDRDGAPRVPAAGWIEASACTIAGYCPDCGRPAHRVLPGEAGDRAPGWYHDSRADMNTCWSGKGTVEGPRGEHAAHIGPAQLRSYLAAHGDAGVFTTADVAEHMGWDDSQADAYLRIAGQDRAFGELTELAGGWMFRLAGDGQS